MEPGQILLSCLLVLSLSLVEISTDSSLNSTQESRAGKLISMFQIVKFKNEACAAGGVRNGTCYTVTLSCGATTVENCTYLVETGSASTISPCKYTVCPCSRDICRIRFDFMVVMFQFVGGAIGDCTTDTFTITAPGNFAPPLICGFNSGQHTTHLSNQQQSMCWRQETNTCAICWIPEILGTDQITSDVATEDADTFVVGSIGSDVRLSDRVCGRQLSSANDNGDRRMSLSVCTQQRPFRMTFKTDADEVTLTSTSAAPNSAASNELSRIPGGIVGFNLRWTLQACS
ncbi:hypothetical protein TCAL_15627 [Tigriopus californicus]|uniref:CUB domain-containing protein n=1 Tax=Tigriopus californicus TaxID=6832 RepID=A0A553PCH9_TIGCA|nr:hypothetical protein TCAL_15627 [Tigriopus californicus]